MTEDTVFALFSCTKAITATAVLQLVEQGRLELDAPAKAYLPEIGALQVLEGFDDAGAPRLRPPKRDVTTRMLMLHTAGFGYEFFNAEYRRLTLERGQINPRLGTRAGLNVPLLFDPGERWEYGLSLDWAGRVVEAVTGETLDAVLRAGVLEPLGMNDTAFALSPGMRERRAAMHQFDENGALVPFEFELPEAPEVFMGGGALFGTVGDYMRFLRMWLNDGAGERGRVLKAGDRRLCRPEWSGRSRGEAAARRQSRHYARRRILSRPVEVLGAELHGQRPGGAHRSPRRLARLGRPRQSLLLDRPPKRDRRFLGDADVSLHAPDAARRILGFRDGDLREPQRPHARTSWRWNAT